MENNNYQKLINTLKYIFQIDRGDLDFGIYRILNQKHDEITNFLEQDLIPQVKQELDTYESGDKEQLEAELEKLTSQLRELGVSDEDQAKNTKVADIQAKLNTVGRTEELENEVFSHLVRFFERYYEEGDFISKRRYKDGVYAIPYEGEEVKLHWANHDQYYIKTSERFKDFSFRVSDKRVHFRISEAETDSNNNKNTSGKDRRFVLVGDDFWDEKDGELSIYFEFKSLDEKKTQDACNVETAADVLKSVPDEWQSILATLAPTEKQKNRTVLDKYLTSYSARNTFDYFIHKDLGTFLTRELDFYIKNEVMFLDDIENENAPKADQYLAKVRVIRSIAKKIIRMLAQLEDFQKKLWEKKKFVVGTGYCITLDLVPEQYYDAILQNQDQLQEWRNLGFIDDSTDLNHDYLKAHPTLSIDTKFFPEMYDDLLAGFDNIDEQVNGLLINSENFGALNLLQELYKEQIKAVYIDPPYNTDATKILYKNNYEHSSWLSFIHDRLSAGKKLITKDGLMCITIDDAEFSNLQIALDQVFGKDLYVATTLIRNNPSGRSTLRGFSLNHEYGLFYAKTSDYRLGKLPHTSKQLDRYSETHTDGRRYEWENLRRNGPDSDRVDRPREFFPFYFNEESGHLRVPELYWDKSDKIWSIKEKPLDEEIVLYPIHPEDSEEKVWRYQIENYHEEPWRYKCEIVNGKYEIYRMKFVNVEGVMPRTWWDKPEYSARDNGTRDVKNLFGKGYSFDFPKAIGAVSDSVKILSNNIKKTYVLDYFAGSGTTGHAVLRLNREDNEKESGSGQRKYIMVEMGEYFNTVTKPRMQKVVYSDDWKDGKPQDDGVTGTPQHVIKYFKLESYEDTLNNLELVRTDEQQATLESHDRLREDYTLGYMLDVEATGSVLSLESFQNPFAYSIQLATDVVGETKTTPVDLVETFNYLIGLKVVTRRRHGEHLLVLEGVTRVGEKTLVIWRNQDVVDNDGLDDFFRKQALSTTDFEYQKIYVNGDNNLENLKVESDQWKVGLIEEEFHNRMFS